MLEIELIKEALDRCECEEFEIALEHKSKLRAYKELKRSEWLSLNCFQSM